MRVLIWKLVLRLLLVMGIMFYFWSEGLGLKEHVFQFLKKEGKQLKGKGQKTMFQ